jgi:DNA-binding Lrp family transcriptional regulator
MELDDTNLKIINLLQNDARMSHKQMAAVLNKSQTAIHVRIKNLEKEGFIKRYATIIDHKKIDKNLIGYTQVHLQNHTRENLKAFKEEVIKLSEVMECYHMTGAFDFLLRIAIKDMDEYNELLINKLSLLPSVANMQSFFVMSETKNETAYIIKPHISGE